MQRSAATGLLLVCVLLAVALGLTAMLSYRAATTAGRAVLHSRAIEAAAAFTSGVRGLGPGATLQQIGEVAREASGGRGDVAIAFAELQGRVLAAAPASEPSMHVSSGIREELRLRGQVVRMVKLSAGTYLEYWQPVLVPHREGMPPAWRLLHGLGPDRPPRGEHGRSVKLLRVTVKASLADSLMKPAQTTGVLAWAVSAVLLLVGLLIHQIGKRAHDAEQELHRRRALAALGEMAAVLAHEIRTPLGSIKGNAQLIGEGNSEDERIQAIVHEAGRLERLVNGLLDYSRPREPQRASVDPDELATRAAQIVAPRAAAAGVDLVTDLAQCGACLKADADQMLQVLVNLLQNAVEACAGEPGSGPCAVVIRVRCEHGTVSFAVLDPGPGFDEANVEQLFRPFFSGRPSGTGLGLSVARQIVEQHGGRIVLANRPEHGAIAEVTLPEEGRLR